MHLLLQSAIDKLSTFVCLILDMEKYGHLRIRRYGNAAQALIAC